MSRRLAAVLMVTGVMVAGCGGGGDESADRAKGPTPSSSTTSTTIKPLALTAEQLTPALLQLTDMPTGWSTDPELGTDEPSDTGGYCTGPNALARAQAAGSTVHVTAAYTASPTVGPYLSLAIFAFPTVDAARSFMAATQERISACTTFVYPDANSESGTSTDTISALNYPKLGDETIALRETTAAASGATISRIADVAFIRKDNLVALVQEGGLSVDATQAQQFATRQTEALVNLGV